MPPGLCCLDFLPCLKSGDSYYAHPGIEPDKSLRWWGGALWSPSYFAGSCGGAPIEIIRQYIEQQQTPH
jgi:putative transposase